MPENNTAADATQTTILFSSPDQEQLDISTLETWLWEAAGEVSFHAHPRKRISGASLNCSNICRGGVPLPVKFSIFRSSGAICL